MFHPIGVVGSLGLLSIPSEPDQPTLIARTSAVRSSTGIVGRAPLRELQFLPHSQDAASYSMAAGATDHLWGIGDIVLGDWEVADE